MQEAKLAHVNAQKAVFDSTRLAKGSLTSMKNTKTKKPKQTYVYICISPYFLFSLSFLSADLREAIFKNARFIGANMVQAILCSSDLRSARLTRADCTGSPPLLSFLSFPPFSPNIFPPSLFSFLRGPLSKSLSGGSRSFQCCSQTGILFRISLFLFLSFVSVIHLFFSYFL